MNDFFEAIGYTFKNLDLVYEALRHSSYANESHKNLRSNERLEFLGDSVMGFVVSDFLFKTYPTESERFLTEKKSRIVSTAPLASVLTGLGLSKYIVFGKGVFEAPDKVKEDVFEALVGAIYLDGGIEFSSEFVLKFLIKSPFLSNSAEATKDYKSALKIYYDKAKSGYTEYFLIEKTGPDNDARFKVGFKVDGNIFSVGHGTSLKRAEQDAAKNAVTKLLSEGKKIEL